MAKILIVYGTTEGQTRKIAEFAGRYVTGKGHEADVCDATKLTSDFALSAYEGVLVAASLHAGHHQKAIEHFVRHHLLALSAMRTSFLSISLSAAGDAGDQEDAWTAARTFLHDTAWTPTYTHIVAGALRYTQYDFFRRWVMKRIAREKSAPTDTTHDVEYTDWTAVEYYVDEVLEGS